MSTLLTTYERVFRKLQDFLSERNIKVSIL